MSEICTACGHPTDLSSPRCTAFQHPPFCPVCALTLFWHHNGLWCPTHGKVETCCEGAPQT